MEVLPFEAAREAGTVHARYREAGGMRDRTLPDFLIGALALWSGHRLLPRDPERYRACFPTLDNIASDTHP